MRILSMSKIVIFAALIGGFFSCQKDKQGPNQGSNESYHRVVTSSVMPSDDNFLFDMEGSSVISEVTASLNEVNRGPKCVKVTDSGPGYPREIIKDFDSCSHVTGKIIITISDSLKNPGAEIIVKYENLAACGKTIDGFRRFKNLGLNSSGNPEFESESDFKMIHKNGDESSYKRYEKVEWIKGFDTEDRKDDEFLITGSEEHTKKDGTVRSKKIVKPIHISRACKYPLSGSIEFAGGKKDGTLDYGDGDCDKKGTFTDTNGVETEVDVRKFWKIW